jgi:hypothetical protein
MTRFTLLGAAAILSTAIATSTLAQTLVQKPGLQKHADRGGDATASVLPPPPSEIGNETSTRPWSAPIGHRQPRADEVPAPTPLTQNVLDQEDIYVDRKINNICRGC